MKRIILAGRNVYLKSKIVKICFWHRRRLTNQWNRIESRKKDIEPNLIYNKYSIYSQREEDELSCKLEREDKKNIAKALKWESMHGACLGARTSHDWRGGVGTIERNDVKEMSRGLSLYVLLRSLDLLSKCLIHPQISNKIIMYFLLYSFMVSSITFRSLIYLEFMPIHYMQ